MIKLYTGPMFSGKSYELLKEYEKKFHKDKILMFKPKIDTRDYGVIKTRNNKEVPAILISDLSEIYKYLSEKITTIFIDEANFIQGDIEVLIDLSIDKDLDIYIAGLNLTSELKPFGLMPQIMAISDEIVYLYASCNECNRDASYTYYNGTKDDDILVGNDNYTALCSKCLRKVRTYQK